MSLRTFVATWPGRIAALLLVAATAGGATFVARSNSGTPKAELRTTTITRGSVTQTVSVSGSVSASGQARLAFKTGGRLAEVYVSVGQAVTIGQPLAKLDTTDLATAMSTAQQNLANAQASYQKQLLAASDTRQSLADTQRSTATDIANAQQTLARIKANYTAARSNFGSLTNLAQSDATSLNTALGNLRAGIDTLLVYLGAPGLVVTNDVRSATNSLNQAETALDNARAYVTSVLAPALNDFGVAQSALLQTAGAFDEAVAANADIAGFGATFQTQQFAYNIASSRMSSAIDTVTGPLSSVQTSITAAQTSLHSTTAMGDPALTEARSYVSTVLTMVSQTTQPASTAKTRLTQAANPLSTMNDTIQSSYANAVQGVSAAQDRAATSVRQAQSAVANIPFNLQSAQASVDNANNAVATAQSNLDAAVLTAPAAGIVASIANQIGEFVTGGNTNNAFMVLTNTNAMVLHGTVGEADVSKLKLGQVANVTIDALSGQKMTGKVSSLDPVATISQGVPVYGIDIAIDVPASSLKAGMSGTAAVILAAKQNVLLVPNTAIRTASGQRGVQVLKGGEAVDTPVTFGLANDQFTEAVSGLSEGDVVVIPQARATTSAQPNRGPGGGGQQVIFR
ncbi:MAG TPA: efflux RND transporter periplasmic adaptor subunit [Candidatus Limnocylindria bacterium]|nr:efflux RND transporter periplasmic adaptor subunit [Candidatus Limnocylindria bacterium]